MPINSKHERKDSNEEGPNSDDSNPEPQKRPLIKKSHFAHLQKPETGESPQEEGDSYERHLEESKGEEDKTSVSLMDRFKKSKILSLRSRPLADNQNRNSADAGKTVSTLPELGSQSLRRWEPSATEKLDQEVTLKNTTSLEKGSNNYNVTSFVKLEELQSPSPHNGLTMEQVQLLANDSPMRQSFGLREEESGEKQKLRFELQGDASQLQTISQAKQNHPSYLSAKLKHLAQQYSENSGSPSQDEPSPLSSHFRKVESDKTTHQSSPLKLINRQGSRGTDGDDHGEMGSKTPKLVFSSKKNGRRHSIENSNFPEGASYFKSRKENFKKSRGIAPIKHLKLHQWSRQGSTESPPSKKSSPTKSQNNSELNCTPSDLGILISAYGLVLNISYIVKAGDIIHEDHKQENSDVHSANEEEDFEEELIESSPYIRGYYSDSDVQRFRETNADEMY
mgnify:CR=1 FL=1